MLYKINVFFMTVGLLAFGVFNFSESQDGWTQRSNGHKFYVSTTNVEYNPNTNSLEMIQRVFTDDLENVLRARYGPDIKLAEVNEPQKNAQLIKQYILKQWDLKNQGQSLALNYLGHQYDIDQVKIFIEVPLDGRPDELFFQNKTLFDLTSDQQNIIHVTIQKQRRSLLLFSENPNGVLIFD